jgi:tight adherence protein B
MGSKGNYWKLLGSRQADMTTTFLLLLPIIAGIVLLWVFRNDRRRQFVQQRLQTLTEKTELVSPSLRLELQRVASFMMLPQSLRKKLDAEFAAAGKRIGPLHLGIAGLIAAVIVAAFTTYILGLSITFVSLSSLIAAIVAPVVFLHVAQSRYQRHFLDVFPDALDLVRRGIRSGLPVNESLVVAGREIADPVGKELRRALDQVQVGVTMNDALQELADRIRVADFRFFVVALVLQQKTGGSLAETLQNLSGVIRARKALRLKARSLTAEAKVSAMVLAALPFVVGGAMYVMNKDLVRPLFTDPSGRFMMGLAFMSLLTGLAVMYVLVRRAIR